MTHSTPLRFCRKWLRLKKWHEERLPHWPRNRLGGLAGGDRTRLSPELDFKRVRSRWADTVHTDGSQGDGNLRFYHRLLWRWPLCVRVCVCGDHGDPRCSSLTRPLGDKCCSSSEWKPNFYVFLVSPRISTENIFHVCCTGSNWNPCKQQQRGKMPHTLYLAPHHWNFFWNLLTLLRVSRSWDWTDWLSQHLDKRRWVC